LPLLLSIQTLSIQILSCSAAKTSVGRVVNVKIKILKIEKSRIFILLENISAY